MFNTMTQLLHPLSSHHKQTWIKRSPIDEVGLPWLAVMCPPSLSVSPLERAEKILWKSWESR